MHIAPHKTAMTRKKPSLPLRKAMQHGFIRKDSVVLDYGCGKGFDVTYLDSLHIEAFGYDKYYHPFMPKGIFDVVMLSYVLNVIPDKQERIDVLKQAWDKTDSVLVVSVRMYEHMDYNYNWTPYNDGFVTSANTFQHYYRQGEIEQLFLEHTSVNNWKKLGEGIYALYKPAS